MRILLTLRKWVSLGHHWKCTSHRGNGSYFVITEDSQGPDTKEIVLTRSSMCLLTQKKHLTRSSVRNLLLTSQKKCVLQGHWEFSSHERIWSHWVFNYWWFSSRRRNGCHKVITEDYPHTDKMGLTGLSLKILLTLEKWGFPYGKIGLILLSLHETAPETGSSLIVLLTHSKWVSFQWSFFTLWKKVSHLVITKKKDPPYTYQMGHTKSSL